MSILSLFTPISGALLILIMAVSSSFAEEAGDLSLATAITLSLAQDDPSVMAPRLRAEAMRAQAKSQSSLPNPKMSLGLANLPAHSFDYDQDPMSQLKIGLHQDIPSRTKRRLLRERDQNRAEIFDHQATGQQLALTRKVRLLWLRLLYVTRAKNILREKEEKLEGLNRSLEDKYLSGASAAQNILLLGAETALLEDRQEQLAEEENITRLKLARYMGDMAMTSTPFGSYNQFSTPLAVTLIEDSMPEHPDLLQYVAKIQAETKSIDLAHQAYKPNWGFDVGYGLRGGGRSNLLTAMVTFDMPIFTGNRQDKKLTAARKLKLAAEHSFQAMLDDMIRNLNIFHVKWNRSSGRLNRYEDTILPRTQEAAKAVERSYAMGNSSYGEMIRILLDEMDIRLKIEDLKMRQAQAIANLIYFEGDMK